MTLVFEALSDMGGDESQKEGARIESVDGVGETGSPLRAVSLLQRGRFVESLSSELKTSRGRLVRLDEYDGLWSGLSPVL